MPSTIEWAQARQARLITLSERARSVGIRAWRSMDFDDLSGSWNRIEPDLVAAVTAAQSSYAAGADLYTRRVAVSQGLPVAQSSIVAEAFSGVDGEGRPVAGTLRGAVTTSKQAVGAGLGRRESLLAGQTYLGAIMQTLVADLGRSSDKVSFSGRGATYFVRVVQAGACSRCAILAGKSSAPTAFKRHRSCHCTAVGFPGSGGKIPDGFFSGPDDYFESLSSAEQERIFTKAGAEAIREGASATQVVNARRGASGMGYSHRITSPSAALNRMQKTTIGRRPDGTLVQVYATSEANTRRGAYGRAQEAFVRGDGRYSTSTRVRLMPEQIFTIAGDDKAVRQAFLRDAGYLDYLGVTDVPAQRIADRILVDRATLRYGNFTLGR